MVNGLVDGLVVLEIGRKDVAQVAQLIVDAILDHAALVLREWARRQRSLLSQLLSWLAKLGRFNLKSVVVPSLKTL